MHDRATAAIFVYGLIEAKTAGTSIPDDAAYDKAGKPTTNPAAVLDGGALRSFDRRHRGSNLGMIIEVLAGLLVGAGFSGLGDSMGNWGHLVFAIDPELLGDRVTCIANVQQIVDQLAAVKTLPGGEKVYGLQFRVEPQVTRRPPHRPGRAQLTHPVPQVTVSLRTRNGRL